MPNGDALSLLQRLADAADYVDAEKQDGNFLMRRVGKRRYDGI